MKVIKPIIERLAIEDVLDTVMVGDVLDKLRLLPDDCVDVSVTSPPYNKRRNLYGWLVMDSKYSHTEDHLPEGEYEHWQIEILNELFRVTKPGGSLFYNHKIRWDHGVLLHPYSWVLKSTWTVRQEIIWDRTLAANVRGWRFWQVDERIYWLYKPIDNNLVGEEIASKHAKLGSIWRMKPSARTESHPAPFPLELPIRAIASMCGDAPKVVLDPFCGTGTTLVAAKILGHSYIGIDLSPEYVKHAYERLEKWSDEMPIAAEEIKRHKVKDPFSNRKERGTVNWPNGPKRKKSDK